MKKATFEQLKRLKELNDSLKTKNNSEKRAVFVSFLQNINEIDIHSKFSSEFELNLSLLNLEKDSKEKIEDIENLMKETIEHYQSI